MMEILQFFVLNSKLFVKMNIPGMECEEALDIEVWHECLKLSQTLLYFFQFQIPSNTNPCCVCGCIPSFPPSPFCSGDDDVCLRCASFITRRMLLRQSVTLKCVRARQQQEGADKWSAAVRQCRDEMGRVDTSCHACWYDQCQSKGLVEAYYDSQTQVLLS